MGKPTVTSPVGEAEEATSKSTIIVGKVKDICGEHACMLTNFLRIVGVSNSYFIPHNCKSKDFYSHLIRHVIKPDQVLLGQIISLLTIKPAPGAELKEWKIFDYSCIGVQAQENWEVSLYCSRFIYNMPCQVMNMWFNKFEAGYLSFNLYPLGSNKVY